MQSMTFSIFYHLPELTSAESSIQAISKQTYEIVLLQQFNDGLPSGGDGARGRAEKVRVPLHERARHGRQGGGRDAVRVRVVPRQVKVPGRHQEGDRAPRGPFPGRTVVAIWPLDMES